jgi:hypothetical protein
MRLVAAAGLFWVIFLFALTFTDYLSRRPTASPQPSHSAALRRHDSQEQLRDFDVFLSGDHAANSSDVFVTEGRN